MLMRKVPKGRFTLDTSAAAGITCWSPRSPGSRPSSATCAAYKDWKEGKFSGDHKLFLLNGASRSWEFGYLDELRKFAAEVPWLQYVPTVSRPWDDQKWKAKSAASMT